MAGVDCPKCKYPNKAGATHCGMCYEVFNRSAADAYLRQSRRERHEREFLEGDFPAEQTAAASTGARPEPEKISVNWAEVRSQSWGLARSYWRGLLMGLAGTGLFLGIAHLNTPSVWVRLFGTRIEHRYQIRGPVTYLTSFTSEFRSWAERSGQFVTPLPAFRLDEIGNLTVQRTTASSKKQWTLKIRSDDWIRTLRQGTGLARADTINKNHPTLRGGSVLLDAKGKISQRLYPPRTRTARMLVLLVPNLPSKRLRPGASWTDRFSWTDSLGEWTFQWTAAAQWRYAEVEEIGSKTFAMLIGTVQLSPKILSGPSWATPGFRKARFIPTEAAAKVYFDRHRGMIVSHSLSYAGQLRLPLDSLDRIPAESRVGRAVKAPGEIVLDLSNRLDLQQR